MQTETGEQKTVIIGTIGLDAHIVGATILAHALREAGFNVIHLGAIVTQEEFVNATKETAAVAICVSSIYGMGLLDCEGFKDKLIEAGLDHVKLYVGGLLTAAKLDWEETERRFKELGFDRVYPPGTLPDRPIADLRKDLAV